MRLRAAIFDMDGVVTRTAALHAGAWKALFDDYLSERARRGDGPFVPFDARADYLRYLDGRGRYEGVRTFLTARGIDLPWGAPGDAPGAHTVCGLGNAKDALIEARLARDGVAVFETTLALIRALRARGVRAALATSSKHGAEVIAAAGVAQLFDAHVDGNDLERLGLSGKPAPDLFLEAVRRLDADPGAALVVEDAVAGVEAGRRGGFALVIGIDRGGNREALAGAGADLVVADLGEVTAGSLLARFAAARAGSAADPGS